MLMLMLRPAICSSLQTNLINLRHCLCLRGNPVQLTWKAGWLQTTEIRAPLLFHFWLSKAEILFYPSNSETMPIKILLNASSFNSRILLFRQTEEYQVPDDLLIQDQTEQRGLILLLICEICGLGRVVRFVVYSVYPAAELELARCFLLCNIAESGSSSRGKSSASSYHWKLLVKLSSSW